MTKDKAKKVSAFLLLDRTGSMSMKWDETLSSLNSYVKDVGKKLPESRFTVACFDQHGGFQFDVLRDNVSVEKWKPLTNEDAAPRGTTPLYDAIARMVGLAEQADKKRTTMIVITDGLENASQETTKEGAKAMLDRCKNKKWDVIFLGADFDAMEQAHSVGVARGQTVNTSAGNYGATMAVASMRTARFAASGTVEDFTEEERDKAAGRKPKDKTSWKSDSPSAA